MDAPNTQKTLDALADIFLTSPNHVSESDKSYARRLLDEVNGIHVSAPVRLGPKVSLPAVAQGSSSAAAASTASSASSASSAPITPTARSSEPQDQPTSSPPPLTDAYQSAIDQLLDEAPDVIATLKPPRPMHGAPQRQPAPAPGPRPGPDLHLADDRINRPAHRQPRQMPDHASTRLEIVLLGSLPGFGGPWLTQYAHHLAQQNRGPVAIIHLHPQQTDIELVTAGKVAVDLDLNHIDGDASDPQSSAGSIEASQVDALLRDAEVGLIHVDGAEQLAYLGPLLDGVNFTILCGAYDAAVVDAFTRIKQIVATLPANADRPRLRVMIMGSDQDKSLATLRKLNAAAGDLLTQPIELAGWRKQMQPLQTRPLASLATDEGRWQQLVSVLAVMSKRQAPMQQEDSMPADPPRPQTPTRIAPAANTGPRRHTSTATGHEPQPDDMAAAIRQALLGDDDENDAPAPISEPRPDTAPRAKSSPEAATPRNTPRREANQSSQATHSSDQPDSPDLTRFLPETPGLALEARCPRHPRMQLLLDEQGCIHLLHRATALIQPGSLQSDVAQLIAAGTWVREHLPLLRLTQRQCRFDQDAQPVLHLFTDQARAAAAMVATLGSVVHLHLLQEVRLGDTTTWCCAELT